MPSVNGIPSVTEILQATGLMHYYGFLDSERLDLARRRGKALHLAIQMDAEGPDADGMVLNVKGLHPEIRPGFDGWREFVASTGWEWLHSELELFHEWGFCGHVDLVGRRPGVGIEVVDVKFTDYPDLKGTARQLAGYGLLWDHAHPDQKHVQRTMLQITRDGRPKPVDMTDPHHVQVFIAGLTVFKEMDPGQRRGR